MCVSTDLLCASCPCPTFSVSALISGLAVPKRIVTCYEPEICTGLLPFCSSVASCVPCILQQDRADVAAMRCAAGRCSTPALKKQAYQRNPSQSRSLDLVPGQEEPQQGRLGMSPELAAWWGEQGGAGDMGADPLQGWLGRDQQARAIYKRQALLLNTVWHNFPV